MKQFVIFSLSDQDFAIEIESVNEVTESKEITPVPKSPEELEGIINLRGEVMPVINLKRVLKMNMSNKNDSQIMVVGNDDKQVGLMIDYAKDVKDFDEDSIEQTTSIIQGSQDHYKGVMTINDNLVLILDIAWLIGNPDYSISELSK